jgi:multicomponent K+:H+ antiporter subunit G
MNDLPVLPEWVAIVVSVLVLTGAVITLIGAIGLVRLATFYQRVHAPTLGTSLGAAFVLIGSSIYSSVALGHPVVHEALVFVFIVVTTPVTLMLLARAALYRDRAEGDPTVPALAPSPEPE